MSVNYDLTGTAIDFDALKTEGVKVGLVAEDQEKNDEKQQCYRNVETGTFIFAYRCADNSTSFCTFGLNHNSSDALDELAVRIGAECLCEHDEEYFDLFVDNDKPAYNEIVKVIPDNPYG